MENREILRLSQIEAIAKRIIAVLDERPIYRGWRNDLADSLRANDLHVSVSIAADPHQDLEALAASSLKDALNSLGLEIFNTGGRKERLS